MHRLREEHFIFSQLLPVVISRHALTGFFRQNRKSLPMRHTRYLVVVLILTGVLVSAGAVPWRGSPALAPAAIDPTAVLLLDRVLAAIDPERITSLETDIWQKVQLPDFEYEADGSYLMGSDQRYRMELHTHVGSHTGTLLQVSDGECLWQATRSNPGAWTQVTCQHLHQVPRPGTIPVKPVTAAAAPGVFPIYGFTGVYPLLCNLRSRLAWTGQEKMVHNGEEHTLLTGRWLPQVAAVLVPAEQPWPAGLPVECRLYLRTQDLWPARLEWWGSAGEGGPLEMLVCMEFRLPRLNVPLSEERCIREFSFDPGETKVRDLAGSLLGDLDNRPATR
jgi:hypothetical protein